MKDIVSLCMIKAGNSLSDEEKVATVGKTERERESYTVLRVHLFTFLASTAL